jgi:hypothetical protein
MKILSIDVGIKNLAFCLFDDVVENAFQITNWNTIDLSQESLSITPQLCKEICKNNKCCNKPAKYTKNLIYYCMQHSKKQPFHIPKLEMKSTFINKQKVQQLRDLANKYNITFDNSAKRSELILLLNAYMQSNCFEPITSVTVNASKLDLITIGRNIQLKFDSIFKDDISTITNVIIENQISPIANRMKTIQGMIAQYFIMRNASIQIEFISATNKLKNDGELTIKSLPVESNIILTEKAKYKNRKNAGIQKCLEYITQYVNIVTESHKYPDWKLFFTNHNKKDDLSDSFLQGVWYINSILCKNKL